MHVFVALDANAARFIAQRERMVRAIEVIVARGQALVTQRVTRLGGGTLVRT